MLQEEFVKRPTRRDILVKNCDEECSAGNIHPQQRDEGNPFNFSPQLIHLHKDHQLFEDGDVHRHMYLQDLYISEADDRPTLSVSEFACHISGCSAVHNTLEEYEHHYNSLHRHVCCSCRRSLPTARLLDIHIQEWHDSLFSILSQRQDMYQCLVEGCEQKFRTSAHRRDHLIRIHKYPPDFRFDKTKRDKETRELRSQQQKDTSMEIVDDVCKSEGVCEVLASKQPEQEESVEMQEDVDLTDSSNSATLREDLSSTAHNTMNMSAEPVKPRYSYSVPSSVCFGHGSVRGFRGRRGRRK
ncbi:zinc finger protein 511 [Aulostomus maculatus]